MKERIVTAKSTKTFKEILQLKKDIETILKTTEDLKTYDKYSKKYKEVQKLIRVSKRNVKKNLRNNS